jgi:hypothetical protein
VPTGSTVPTGYLKWELREMSDDQAADDMSPENPSFWDAWGELTPDWRTLPARERGVVAHAHDHSYLSDVIPYFLGHPVGGGWLFSDDKEAIQALIPDFSGMVSRLVEAGRIEIREMPSPESEWDDVPPIDPARIAAVLADPAAWSESAASGGRRVMLALKNDSLRRLEPIP